MAYQNNGRQSNSNTSYQKKNWNSNGSNRSYNQESYQQPQRRQYKAEPKKHSGCSAGLSNNADKTPYVQGWKVDKENGLRKFFAFPYKGTKQYTSETGKVWENWIVEITPKDGRKWITTCLYDVQTRKVIINDLGFVMNPKGGKGGYVGTFINN